MGRKFLLLWILFLFIVVSEKANAVYYSLSEEQISQAIEYGENNKDTDYFTFLDEWMTVDYSIRHLLFQKTQETKITPTEKETVASCYPNKAKRILEIHIKLPI